MTTRRIYLALLAIAISMTTDAFGQNLSAASYPTGPIKLVVGYAPGGPTDLAARLIAAKLLEAWGQPVIVENKPGASSNIANGIVAKAKPDGLTLLVAAAPFASNPYFLKDSLYNPNTSFEPITQVMSAPAILAVQPSAYKDLKELIADAEKKPGELSYASTGVAGTQHFAGEFLQREAHIKLLHVPFKGGAPALAAMMGGQTSMGFVTSLGAVPYFKSNKLRALAVAANERLNQLPDVPTMKELGYPGVVIDSWSGVLAPAGTPKEIVHKIHAAVVKALQSPDVSQKLMDQGAVVVASSEADFAKFIAEQSASMEKLSHSIQLH